MLFIVIIENLKNLKYHSISLLIQSKCGKIGTRKNSVFEHFSRRVCTALIYFEIFLALASTMTGCISISLFASLLGIPIEITSSQ